MNLKQENLFTYQAADAYQTSVAYFSMEFAIDQSLKIYSGGLGFLAGSHLRSAYELKQNLLGIGMLWKYGYYDQGRDADDRMKPEFIRKDYTFLQDTGIVVTVQVHGAPVHVKAYLLPPDTFGSAPLLLLSTDVPENDYLARTITHHLYDEHADTRIAQSIVLGIGGAMVLDALGIVPDVYHMNEGHSVPLNFYLYAKYQNLSEVQKRVVFTTHTPEMAGNEAHPFAALRDMSFFYHLQEHEVRLLLGMDGDEFNFTLAALKFSRIANGVSQLHGEVARRMWGGYPNICEIIAITNAQNKTYWKDQLLEDAFAANDDNAITSRKKALKRELFKEVANQCGKLFKDDVLTIVWARRFAGYKRADLVMYDWQRFLDFIHHSQTPVQIIWADKPYPEDGDSIDLFNQIIEKARFLPNCAVLTGYELGLSALLKKGTDVWLNNPRMYHEASGTSGMSAAMNGAINVSLPDGWVPEFAKDKENCFVIPKAPDELNDQEKDHQESINLLNVLEQTVIPIYYEQPAQWLSIVKKAAAEIVPAFESGRMVDEYYQKMYKSK
ncbi:MAG TPA: alpha-glucan family phosphorylase [Mucilaginibacter sp.]|nr:alpha-glucan family phosphorylase [Mucilaginibacter sp.]